MFPRPLCALPSQTMWCVKKKRQRTTKSQTGERGREKHGYTIRYETRGVLPSSRGTRCSIPICPALVCGGEDALHRELAGGTLREWRACSRFFESWNECFWFPDVKDGRKYCESTASIVNQGRGNGNVLIHADRYDASVGTKRSKEGLPA